jgi:hypothetical protein
VDAKSHKTEANSTNIQNEKTNMLFSLIFSMNVSQIILFLSSSYFIHLHYIYYTLVQVSHNLFIHSLFVDIFKKSIITLLSYCWYIVTFTNVLPNIRVEFTLSIILFTCSPALDNFTNQQK